MKLVIDKVEGLPKHALTKHEFRFLFSSLPDDWTAKLQGMEVHLCNELPSTVSFPRPVIYSDVSHRLNISSRGLAKQGAAREILREFALIVYGTRTRKGHRLDDQEIRRLDQLIEPHLKMAMSKIDTVQPDTPTNGRGGHR